MCKVVIQFIQSKSQSPYTGPKVLHDLPLPPYPSDLMAYFCPLAHYPQVTLSKLSPLQVSAKIHSSMRETALQSPAFLIHLRKFFFFLSFLEFLFPLHVQLFTYLLSLLFIISLSPRMQAPKGQGLCCLVYRCIPST